MPEENVQVVVRVRPLTEVEKNRHRVNWEVKKNSIYQIDENGHSIGDAYYFDHVFENISNKDIYAKVVKKLVVSSLEGFNSTIFAYGPSSSGKTYTMLGSSNDPGIIKLSASDIFSYIHQNTERRYLIRVSYIEVYKEQIIDLLDPSNGDVRISDNNHFVTVKEEVVPKESLLPAVMAEGHKNRKIFETAVNGRNSSHTIFRIIIESHGNNNKEIRISHINLVDLTGSGARFNNLLQPALGGNTKTLVIANIKSTTVEETNSTLLFAKHAKIIKNKPIVNSVVDEECNKKRYKMLIDDYERKFEALKEYVNQLHQQVEAIQSYRKIDVTKRRHTIGGDQIPLPKDSEGNQFTLECRGTLSVLPDVEDEGAEDDIFYIDKESPSKQNSEVSEQCFREDLLCKLLRKSHHELIQVTNLESESKENENCLEKQNTENLLQKQHNESKILREELEHTKSLNAILKNKLNEQIVDNQKLSAASEKYLALKAACNELTDELENADKIIDELKQEVILEKEHSKSIEEELNKVRKDMKDNIGKTQTVLLTIDRKPQLVNNHIEVNSFKKLKQSYIEMNKNVKIVKIQDEVQFMEILLEDIKNFRDQINITEIKNKELEVKLSDVEKLNETIIQQMTEMKLEKEILKNKLDEVSANRIRDLKDQKSKLENEFAIEEQNLQQHIDHLQHPMKEMEFDKEIQTQQFDEVSSKIKWELDLDFEQVNHQLDENLVPEVEVNTQDDFDNLENSLLSNSNSTIPPEAVYDFSNEETLSDNSDSEIFILSLISKEEYSTGYKINSTTSIEVITNGKFLQKNSLIEVFNVMPSDKISFVAQSDSLITLFGESYLNSHRGKDIHTVVSYKMRQLARLKMALQKTVTFTSVIDVLKCEFYNDIVAATQKISGYNPETRSFKTLSLAVHLRTNLKFLCDVAKNAIRAKNPLFVFKNRYKLRKEVAALKEVIIGNWKNDMSNLTNKSFNEIATFSNTNRLRNISFKNSINKVFNRMRSDKIRLVAQSDPLITLFGEWYLNKHKDKHIHSVVANKMRELARLKMALQKTVRFTSLVDVLKPELYGDIVAAAQKISGYNPETRSFQTLTLALRLRPSLKFVCDVARNAIRRKNPLFIFKNRDQLKEIVELRRIIVKNWFNDIQ